MTLALSIYDNYQKDISLLAKPITTLAKMAGLTAEDVYEKLVPALIETQDFGEKIRYAETAIKYANIVDRNRLREEVGEYFICALDECIKIVKAGLDSNDHWIKRKAMSLHGELIDEHSEKKRFIETILVDQKIKQLAEIRAEMEDADREIAEFILREGKMQEEHLPSCEVRSRIQGFDSTISL